MCSWQWGALSRAKVVCEYMLRLDRDNRRDTPQYTYEAFDYGTYSKISELINFETRLSFSLQLASVYADYATLSILEVCHQIPLRVWGFFSL